MGDLFVWVYWEAYWVGFHGCNSLIGVCLGGLWGVSQGLLGCLTIFGLLDGVCWVRFA